MKNYLYLPFVLLLGLVVGGWGVRTDLRNTKDELKAAKENAQSSRGTKRNVQIAGEVTKLLNIDHGDDLRSNAGRRKGENAHTDEAMGKGEHLALGDGVRNEKGGAGREDRGQKRLGMTEEERQKEFEDNINKAVELFEVRSKLARKTFADKVGLDEKEEERFVVLVDAMNLRLASEIEVWAKAAEAKDDIGPEEGVRLVNGVTEVMVSAYEDMDREMPENWREKSGGDLNITDFIDPAVALPLAGIGGKMQGVNLK